MEMNKIKELLKIMKRSFSFFRNWIRLAAIEVRQDLGTDFI